MLIVAVLFHLFLTGRGRFPRYEAYLVSNGTIIISTLVARFANDALKGAPKHIQWIMAGTGLFLIIPILMRCKDAYVLVDQASLNVYQQQYQMGEFLGKYYRDTPIAIHDIGAVSYFTRSNKIDLWGLGNFDIARSRKNGDLNPDLINKLIQSSNVQIAVVFETHTPPALLEKWNKIASWQISNNVICTEDSVSFYAVTNNAKEGLKTNLRNFEHSLPGGVIVRYY